MSTMDSYNASLSIDGLYNPSTPKNNINQEITH